MQRLSQPIDCIKPRYDVIVVGSGYGGGVAASRLARAGLKVCVLERGREFLTGEFPTKFPEFSRQMRITSQLVRTGSEAALFDVRLGPDMHVLVGCGLGGGSLVNAGVSLQPDPRVFADQAWPQEIRTDSLLAEGFARAGRWLRPVPTPDGKNLLATKALAKAAPQFGKEPVQPPVAVSFSETVNPAGVGQAACTLCGDCCGGCNAGAKNTIAVTYLPDAQRHGAEIFTLAKVLRVEKEAGGDWRVVLVPTDADKTDTIERTINAATVILAAGTLGSTEILIRSREHGLDVSDRLGHGFSANGDIIAFGYGAKVRVNAIGVGHPARVETDPVGPSVGGQYEITDPDVLDNGLCIQHGVLPSALAPALPVMFIPGGRLLGALQSLVTGVYKGPFQGLQTFFAVSHDNAGGQLRLEDGRLQVHWPDAKDQPVYARLDRALETAVRATGGDYVKNPLAKTALGKTPATAHPLGGCGMAETSAHGVVNHKGQVFDAGAESGETAVHAGLYVLDGSIIPRSLGVNPLLTITALAERAMILLARDKNLNFDDGPRAEWTAAASTA